jgi:hypothetical protein
MRSLHGRAIPQTILAVTLIVVLSVLTGCGGDRYSWNQKLTVVVDTPQGEVSASSVSSVWWREGGNWNTGWTIKFEGEAVALKLPGNRYLFALAQQGDSPLGINPDWLAYVAPASIAGLPGIPRYKRLLAEVVSRSGRARGAIKVPSFQYPTLVVFKEISDPKSARRVDPANLSASFGQGYRLHSVTLEITDEDRTIGKVQAILPWLASMPGLFDGRTFHTIDAPDPLLNSLGPGSFSTEITK